MPRYGSSVQTLDLRYRNRTILEAHETEDCRAVKIMVAPLGDLRVSDLAVLRAAHAELGRMLEVGDAPGRGEIQAMVRSEVARQMAAATVAGLREIRYPGPY